jgi:hypothetical protein
MIDDRFQRALSEANASRLIRDAEDVSQISRNRHVLEVWAVSIISRLDGIMEGYASFGIDRGESKIDYDSERSAILTYTRQGPALRMIVTANAYLDGSGRFKPGLLVGNDFEENSAVMTVEVEVLDTKEKLIDQFRYGLQPVNKLTSIDQEQFLSFLERLVRSDRT